MSSTRQAGVFGDSDFRKSGIEANNWAFNPTDRNSRPTELRRSSSSSMIKTVDRSSEFGSARDKTVSAMGSSPFTQLDLTPASRSFLRQELTHNGYGGIAVLPKNAHKPRFSHQKLPFERFQYRVQPWHRRLVPTARA